MEELNQKIRIETLRFIYSDEFTKEIEYFSKIHQYDDRKTFKEMWTKWIEEENIKMLIEKEISCSLENGYKGDIMDKMYKSARYYYRKKEIKFLNKKNKKGIIENEYDDDADEDEDSTNNYAGLSKEMIKWMDLHIMKLVYNNTVVPVTIESKPLAVIQENKPVIEKNKPNDVVLISKTKPASAFDNFCQNYINEITREVYQLKKKKVILNPNEITLKFKKAYKNRFYKIRLLLE